MAEWDRFWAKVYKTERGKGMNRIYLLKLEAQAEAGRKLAAAASPIFLLDLAHFEERPDEWPIWGSNATVLTMGDVRKLREAVAAARAAGLGA